jgi:hypothetical protein
MGRAASPRQFQQDSGGASKYSWDIEEVAEVYESATGRLTSNLPTSEEA